MTEPTTANNGTRITTRHRWNRAERPQSGQTALVLVLGILLIMALTAGILSDSTIEHSSIVSGTQLDHYAYRALEAGIANFDYNVNANFDYLSCNSSNTVGSNNNPGPAPPATPAQAPPTCQGAPPFNTWQWVHNTSTPPEVPEYYMIGNPQFTLGGPSVPVSVQFIGAAGFPNDLHYQSTTITFKATNEFILNLYWSQYDQVDALLNGQPGCSNYDWSWGNNPPNPAVPGHETLNPGSACDYGAANFFTTGNQIDGPVFSDDSVYVSGTPIFTDPVVTADPWCVFVNPLSWTQFQKTNCNSIPVVVPPGSQTGSQFEPLPSSNTGLQAVAAATGCVYSGPTYITLNAPTVATNNQTTMTVMSNGTPSAHGASGTANDGDLLSSNTNQCMPYGTHTAVPLPPGGVIYVQDEPSTVGCTMTTVVKSETEVSVAQGYPPVGTNKYYSCRGDAVVSGELYGDLTVAAMNNVIIDSDLTYCNDPTSPGLTPACPGPSYPAVAPTYPGTSSVLGLIANEYVEVNNPGGASKRCGSGGALAPPACWPGNIDIDATVLALNHTFLVNNWASSTNTLPYTIYQYGAAAEKYFEVFGTFVGSGTLNTGYNTYSVWDNRLAVFGPPDYLKTGVNGNSPYWNVISAAISVQKPCSTILMPPPVTASTQAPLACDDPSVTFP